MAVDYETEMDYHWRNSMKPVRFFMVDARASVFLIVVILRMFHWWSWALFLTMLLFFWMLEKKGLPFDAALRSFRTWILGARRPAWLWIRKRKFHDYG